MFLRLVGKPATFEPITYELRKVLVLKTNLSSRETRLERVCLADLKALRKEVGCWNRVRIYFASRWDVPAVRKVEVNSDHQLDLPRDLFTLWCLLSIE